MNLKKFCRKNTQLTIILNDLHVELDEIGIASHNNLEKINKHCY